MRRPLPSYATGALAFSEFTNDSSRFAAVPGVLLPLPGGNVNIPGFAESLTGSFGSRSIGGNFEAGYRIRFGVLDVTPFAALQFGVLNNDGYTESSKLGPSQLGLTYSSRTITTLPTFLGLQLKTDTEVGNGMQLSSLLRAAWKSEWSSDRSTRSSFITAPGFDFVVQGATPPRDSLRLTVTEKLTINKNAEIFGSFDGDFAPTGQGYKGSIGLRIAR